MPVCNTSAPSTLFDGPRWGPYYGTFNSSTCQKAKAQSSISVNILSIAACTPDASVQVPQAVWGSGIATGGVVTAALGSVFGLSASFQFSTFEPTYDINAVTLPY